MFVITGVGLAINFVQAISNMRLTKHRHRPKTSLLFGPEIVGHPGRNFAILDTMTVTTVEYELHERLSLSSQTRGLLVSSYSIWRKLSGNSLRATSTCRHGQPLGSGKPAELCPQYVPSKSCTFFLPLSHFFTRSFYHFIYH